jgi:hypothetical protein
MHSHTPFPFRPAGVLLALAAATGAPGIWAQGTEPAERPVQRVERITHEDAGSRIDETRVGGQTRQIDVQTKAGLPAYQVQPAASPQGSAGPAGERSGTQGTAGRTSWRVFNF